MRIIMETAASDELRRRKPDGNAAPDQDSDARLKVKEQQQVADSSDHVRMSWAVKHRVAVMRLPEFSINCFHFLFCATDDACTQMTSNDTILICTVSTYSYQYAQPIASRGIKQSHPETTIGVQTESDQAAKAQRTKNQNHVSHL